MLEKIFAESIYENPVEWGEQTWCDEETMMECIKDLEEQCGFENISIGDCQEYGLVEVVGNVAIYESVKTRKKEYAIVTLIEGGMYDVDGGYYEDDYTLADIKEMIAENRIDGMNFSSKQFEFIFSNWENWDEHLEWFLTASKEEINSWGESANWGKEE